MTPENKQLLHNKIADYFLGTEEERIRLITLAQKRIEANNRFNGKVFRDDKIQADKIFLRMKDKI